MEQIVCINPSKQGANIGVNGYGSEKFNAHITGNRVKEILGDNGGLKKVFTTQGNMTLTEAIRFSNDSKATLHVDIHSNAWDGRQRGHQVCYTSQEGKKLAQYIYDEISKITTVPGEGLKYRPELAALKKTNAVAALVEMFYHDNAEDVAFYKAHKEEFAQAIAKGILHYCGVKVRQIEVYKTVMATRLNVRTTPETVSDKNIIGQLEKGSVVHVGFSENGWANIYYGKEGGWVSEKYLM